MKLTILDPGHFHAVLLQKNMYDNVDANVHVYAPAGPDVQDYLNKIQTYNTRQEQPTNWKITSYTEPDYLERCVGDKFGDVVVIAGNNRRKTEFLTKVISAGTHALTDKPMVIDSAGFAQLEKAFAIAKEKGVLLYDIMTERYEITTMLQKEFSLLPEVFGQLEEGDAEHPAVTKESVHHFSKLVSGAAIKRPAWFFDVDQQGEGLVDITTHLVDMVQWECFPEQILDYRKDIDILSAKRWPTVITPAQFKKVTQLDTYPDYLQKDLHDGSVHVYANGEINYRIKGVHAKVSVLWNFEAPAGAGDTHFSIMRGSKANLVIRQGEEQKYPPVLTIEPVAGVDVVAYEAALQQAVKKVQAKYPGVDIATATVASGWEVTVPASYHVGHEAHFAQVAEKFMAYVEEGGLPEWEVPNMIVKYFTTTKALEMALSK